MDIIYFLIPLALLLLITAIGTFLWAAKHGQFEDLDREAHRILFDEDMVKTKTKNDSTSQNADKAE